MYIVGPRRVELFLDRVDPRALMREITIERQGRNYPSLLVVHGPDGIGRMSVASQYFHDYATSFDLYIEIPARQADGRLVAWAEMVRHALRGFGLADVEQPTQEVALSDTFQRISAGKRFMIVIKDAASAEQVTSLIPHGAPEAVVVVTSRSKLGDLRLAGFADVQLGKLPDAESEQLLKHHMGATASQVDSSVIDESVRLCDGIPLLLQILGLQLTDRDVSQVDSYMRKLRASLSRLLTMDDAQRFVGFLNVAYGELLLEQQQAYRRLAVVPGSGISLQAAAIALDVDEDHAEDLLDDLKDRSLLHYDSHTGRYAYYKHMRPDAERRLAEEDGPEFERSAAERVTRWNLREAIHRDAALADRWRVGPEFDRYAASRPEPLSRPEATAWFDAEWESVVACVRAAHNHGLHEIAWQLCVAVFKYLHLHGHYDPWLDTHELGVASAQACGDQLGIMLVTSQRGAAYLNLGQRDRARADFRASLEAARQAGYKSGEQSALEWLGKTAAADKDFDTAHDCYDESEAVIERAGDLIPAEQRPRMLALLSLHRGRALRDCAEHDRADTAACIALRFFEQTGELDNHAKCLLVIGDAANGLLDYAKAAEFYERAAALFAQDGSRRARAHALFKLGDAKQSLGDDQGAAEAFSTSRELYAALSDAKEDEAGARLNALNGR